MYSKSHTRLHLCLAVICQQHLGQNGQDLLRTTAVTREYGNCCRLGARSVYSIQTLTSLQRQRIRGHIPRPHLCLAVTGHLHFRQNDQDLLRTTAVIQEYPKKNQHRKLTLEKIILPPLLPGLEPTTTSSIHAVLLSIELYALS